MRRFSFACLAVALPAALVGAPTHVAAQGSPWAAVDTTRLLLGPSAYPKLPSEVRADLERRGCRIPQASGPDVSRSEQSHPNNVLVGAFTGRRTRDWAVLCSVADTSRILVYHDGRPQRVDSLAPHGDALYLAKERDAWGFYRVLMRATPEQIRRLARDWGDPAPPRLDHLGIEDYFAGKASEIHFFRLGRWQLFQGMN